MKWRKKKPDAIGYWLRINLVGKPEIRWVVSIDGVLNLHWGEGELVKLRDSDWLKDYWWKKLTLPEPIKPESWTYGGSDETR